MPVQPSPPVRPDRRALAPLWKPRWMETVWPAPACAQMVTALPLLCFRGSIETSRRANPIVYFLLPLAVAVPFDTCTVTVAFLLLWVMRLPGCLKDQLIAPVSPAVPECVFLYPLGNLTVMLTTAAGRVVTVTFCFLRGATVP